jgi:hypothetical protein
MEDFIIYLKGDIVGKSTKADGHKTIIASLVPTTVEAGTYTGKLEITVDKTGRITSISTIEETNPLTPILSGSGLIYVDNGQISFVDKEELTHKPVTVEIPVKSVNGKTGDITIDIPEFKQTFNNGDYDIKQISSVKLGKGVLMSDGDTVFTEEVKNPEPALITISGDAEGEGFEHIHLKLLNVPIEKGGTGATTKDDAIKNLWPENQKGVLIRTNSEVKSIENTGSKKFLTQESGGEPVYSEISLQDLPQIPHSKLHVIPLEKGGTGKTSFTDGIILVKNGEFTTISEKDILSAIDNNLAVLSAELESLTEYTRNIERTLSSRVEDLSKLV